MTRLCKQPPASMKSDLRSSLNPSVVAAQPLCYVRRLLVVGKSVE